MHDHALAKIIIDYWFILLDFLSLIRVLKLFILMDCPMHVHRTRMGLSILYFKGSQEDFFRLGCISVMKNLTSVQTV